MVSMTALAKVHESPESAARMKRRNRAERRLKLYGILAIALAGLALMALLSSVVTKAGGALSAHFITFDLHLDAGKLDPQDSQEPQVIGKANFTGLSKDMLKDAFPHVTDRRTRRQLYDLISIGNAYEIRRKVMDAPGLVGQTIAYSFLASDVADLYLRGDFGAVDENETTGALTVAPDGASLVITSSSNDFQPALDHLRASLARQAQKMRDRAALQENGRRVFEERAEAAQDAKKRAEFTAEAARRADRRDGYLQQARQLDARSGGSSAVEKLGNRDPSLLILVDAQWIKMTEIGANGGRGVALSPVDAHTDIAAADWRYLVTELPEAARKVSDNQIVWLETLRRAGQIENRFNTRFFTSGDSREPELAGIWGALVGTFWTMLVTFALAFPVGVLAAIYLEEFAPKRRLTDLIEVNINNLAAVPSIVFGLLGLSIFLGYFGVPRSAPLAGGIVLALMTLPTIIIASRAAIRAVPPSIRDAALGVGASRLQTSFHHVLPPAMPGILTGTIIGMAQALGETAPLIMIGMVAFIVDIPTGITDSASVLPVQVFRWSDFPERAFEARTAAAILVLLVFLVLMNALAVFLRKRFEQRW